MYVKSLDAPRMGVPLEEVVRVGYGEKEVVALHGRRTVTVTLRYPRFRRPGVRRDAKTRVPGVHPHRKVTRDLYESVLIGMASGRQTARRVADLSQVSAATRRQRVSQGPKPRIISGCLDLTPSHAAQPSQSGTFLKPVVLRIVLNGRLDGVRFGPIQRRVIDPSIRIGQGVIGRRVPSVVELRIVRRTAGV